MSSSSARSAAALPRWGPAVVAPGLLLLLLAWAAYGIGTATGGAFVYPLDDPYIHLAVAENLTQGHYGLNLAEPSSPASSVVWPLLLAPLLALGAGGLAPLLLNVALGLGVVVAAQRLGDEALPGSPAWTGTLVAAVGILALNLAGLVLIGMEHVLQVGLTLVAWIGLVRVARGAAPGWGLVAALALAPLVRYECLALTVPGCAYLALLGHRRAAAGALGTALLGLVAFSLVLAGLGLPLLPTSVLAKADGDGTSALQANLSLRTGWFLVLLLGLVLAAVLRAVQERLAWPLVGLGAVALATGTLHLAVGRLGWFARYEIYVFASLFAALLVLLGHLAPGWVRRGLGFGLAVALGALLVRHGALLAFTPDASRDIHEQHVQMHRFVTDHWQAPVAVNDIGRVSFGHDYFVLDLWGLGSAEALANADNPDPAWMDTLADRHRVEVALVYASSFARLPSSWTAVADLTLSEPRSVVPHDTITFFARSEAAAARLCGVLPAFAVALPRGTGLTLHAESPCATLSPEAYR